MQKSHQARSSFRGKLLAYSAAAGAVVAVTTEAEAQTITNITTTASVTLNGNGTVTSDPFGPADNLTLRLFRAGSVSSAQILVAGGKVQQSVSYGPAAKLTFGQNIGGTFGAGIAGILRQHVGASGSGNFQAAANHSATGYIGFRGSNGPASSIGWLHIRVNADAGGNVDFIGLISNGAGVYGATSDGPILAGQYDESAAVPEPAAFASGLGLLALGAAGIREYRRRKLQASAA